MVVLKRMLDNGHSGYHSLTIPRGPRSIRRKGLHSNKVFKGSEICAFDLLAAVAGNLLGESECSSAFASSSCSAKVDSGSVKIAGNLGRNSPECGDSYDTDVGKRMNEKLDIDGGKYGDITVNNKSINTNDSFLKLGNGVKLGCKDDDDEILYSYAQPYSKIKACKSTHKIDRKVNKLLTSKHWNTAPKLRYYENTNTGATVMPTNNKRYCYGVDTSQRNTPLKKRKLYDRRSVVTYDGGLSNKDDKNASGVKLGEGNGMSNSAFGCQKSDSRNSQSTVVSIKSFEVPEFFIEVPESATVGLLKKTILETLTNILGGGLRVGVLVHGKKIRDDRTLLQTGTSEGSIRIMLEPDSPNQPSLPIRSQNPPISLLHDSPKTVNRSQINLNKDKTGSDSKALVPVTEVNISQRRIRRPFSVSEVEALVQAVEKLGTGRWRDVKLCAFENEKHRTYVDLKDKWKTLVHTARISPQQRRGEPVPQDLLDRVLAAQDRHRKETTKHDHP